MLTGGYALLERQAASIARGIRLLRQEASPPATRSGVELAGDLGLALDGWQREALAASARRLLLNVARQGGKSTVAALLALHQAVYTAGSLVLVVSPSERQSKRLLRTVRRHYGAVRAIAPAVSVGMLAIELRNGSEIHALPGKEDTIRGFESVDLLIVDEAARVPDALMGAVRPMLAVSGGQLVAMSTPAGQRGWWHAAWVNGGDDWQRFEIPATACPRISPEFLAAERRALPRLVYQAEYECAFVEAEDQLFRHEDLQAMLTPGLVGVRLFADEEDSDAA